ncbi:unnamed protein product [Mytilus edulis]|uniref:C-type lectin domain-containing protein n=1 Tax=Mytilus edulis TaxID=6550 RepID=A0A8S3QHG1_MYTED|nr:unnamed protein product [Mytilus edulis]
MTSPVALDQSLTMDSCVVAVSDIRINSTNEAAIKQYVLNSITVQEYSANCKYPSFHCDVGTWIDDKSAKIWACANPTVITVLSVNGSEERVYYKRPGPLHVSRYDNEFVANTMRIPRVWYKCFVDTIECVPVPVVYVLIFLQQKVKKDRTEIQRQIVIVSSNWKTLIRPFSASAICNYPCFRFDVGTWVNDKDTFVFSCSNMSMLTVNGVNGKLCYERRGPFLVSRSGNAYTCMKYIVDKSTTKISLVYATKAKTFTQEPSICDVCSGSYTPYILVALGCNRPALCAIKDVLNDESCTASEPAIDDGLMCNSYACKYPYRKIGKSCYLINKEKVTWDTAFDICLRHGANLAVFQTLGEMLLMKRALKKMNTGYSFFIGGRNINRHISGGDWRWLKNEKMTKMNYFAFAAKQPNGSFGDPQDCLLLYAPERYNVYDDYCDTSFKGFICEK